MQPNWQRHINKNLGKDYQWEAFAKGSSNTLFRGRFEDDCIVLRLNGPVSDTPGVNRKREALLLELISPYPWAPHIIENQVGDGWCAMQSYSPLTTEHTAKNKQIPSNNNSAQAPALINALSKPQQLQLLDAIRDLQNTTLQPTLEDNTNSVLTIDYQQIWDTDHLPKAQARSDYQAIDWIDEIKHRIKALPSLPATLVHHDLHIGNLALDCSKMNTEQSQLVLLDWEYGGIGNAWFDAAALVQFFDIPYETIYTLPSYQNLSDSTFQVGLQQAIELSELINKLWYRTRGE